MNFIYLFFFKSPESLLSRSSEDSSENNVDTAEVNTHFYNFFLIYLLKRCCIFYKKPCANYEYFI